ncbi:hypothetical protein CDAR_100801 [Caerostris darwini]|uniref:Uncharacterized protein n=1 Tax=Caerostris darwini TaxID=1538125 RepID=A0AAV4VV52_9ARAC|nr:hypothetical protein CDAR_100801 [Caerostris darwini]
MQSKETPSNKVASPLEVRSSTLLKRKMRSSSQNQFGLDKSHYENADGAEMECLVRYTFIWVLLFHPANGCPLPRYSWKSHLSFERRRNLMLNMNSSSITPWLVLQRNESCVIW